MSEYQPPPGDEPGAPQYGGMPAYPQYPTGYGMSQPPPPPAQPASIRTAVRLMWVGAALSAVSLVVTLATMGTLKSHVRQRLLDSNTHGSAHDSTPPSTSRSSPRSSAR